MPVEARFDLPPEEALRHFRGKALRPGFAWQDVWKGEHDAAFTVAKMTDMDLLADVHDAVNRAIAQGTTFEQFRRELTPHLMKKGWWGKQEQVDPLTGQSSVVQLGSARRLETIFRTNMMSAYAAGEWAQIQEAKDAAPYLMYDAVDDNRTRPEHRAWDGTVLHVDDPWWDTHRPPNGWNCRCSVVQLSRYDLRAMGKDGPDQAPPVQRREWVNKRTGEVMQVPRGIDPGWDYNPGAAPRSRQPSAAVAGKMAGWPAGIGARFWKDTPAASRADHLAEWGTFLAEALAARARPKGRVMVVGAVAPEALGAIAELAPAALPQTAEIAVRDADVSHMLRDTKDKKLLAAWLRDLPRHLRNPGAVLLDQTQAGAALLYIYAVKGGGQKLVLRLDYRVKKHGVMNLLRTGRTLDEKAVATIRAEIGGKYQLLEGGL